jgi:hypothetical protein
MRFLSTGFYMLLSILGLSVITLGGLIGVQYARGKIGKQDLHSIMRVIGGTHRVIIPSDAYDRYLAFAKDEKAANEELQRNRALPESRVPPGLRDQEARAALQSQLDVQTRLLDDQKMSIERLRGDVEAEKRQVGVLQSALNDERRKNALVDQDEATAKLRKTLTEMDAGDIALFLTDVVRDPSQGGPAEAARIMRAHLTADYSAEVRAAMPPPERQRVIPLLENQFAGVPPDAVVKIFTDSMMGPGEMMVYMMRMNPDQALGVYLRLPANLQEQMAPQLLRNG